MLLLVFLEKNIYATDIPQGGQKLHTVLQGTQTLNTVLEGIYSAQCRCLATMYAYTSPKEPQRGGSVEDPTFP